MGTGWIILIVAGSVLFLVILWLVATYNGLVVGRNRYKNAYAQIDVQLKRRYDLIPNIVECVKGYMAHERDTLEAVIKARNTAFSAGEKAARNPGDPAAMKELGQAEDSWAASWGG
jgi:LemA protein